jgi:transposase
MNKNIKELLGITDLNIEIDPDFNEETFITHEMRYNRKVRIAHLYLSYPMICSVCHTKMQRNGTRFVEHKAGLSGTLFNILRIRKQKYICKSCHVTAMAHLTDLEPNEHILRIVKATASFELDENRSMSNIAMHNFISPMTVIRTAERQLNYGAIHMKWLPRNIAFDDFKSGKFSDAGMSVILMDSDNHRVIDIVRDRKGSYLRNYFMRYSLKNRLAVKTVTVDLFSPYRKIITELFPHAEIIADRFHVVIQAYTALNKIRIKVMNRYGSHTHEYRALKSLWRLLVKDSAHLDFVKYYPRANFRWSVLNDVQVVQRLLSMDKELNAAYLFYQDLLLALHENNIDYLDNLLEMKAADLPDMMFQARKTLVKHRQEIINSFKYGYSNGPIEGANNKIKSIKRTAFGFRNFNHFRIRILLAFKNSFTAINFRTEKAAFLERMTA